MNIEKQIEFDKVKEIWSGLTHTGYAKDVIREAGVILDGYAVAQAIVDTRVEYRRPRCAGSAACIGKFLD